MRTTRFAFAIVSTLALGWALAGCGPEYPNCDNDEDCHEGEYCVNGLCQQCRTDADCPTGQQCTGGRCEDIEGYCESENDCPEGQECRDNRCAEPVETSTDLDADTGDRGCSIEAVYFDFDSADLQSNARDQIQANVECMREKDIESVHLTGYTDPRGTEEYNLALGDRRARSVRKYMSDLGISADDIGVSSMGEEMASGTDEESWARDRKVEFEAR
ncbi:MAG: OmpA family protein [Myxococcota bacterium]